jgi:hypothetical protein
LREQLGAICADRETAARFFNTLSLLEHIGSRKIMSARVRVRDSALLKHLAEETRHAFFFKRAAEKTAGRPLDYAAASTLAGAAAAAYMGRLDARISRVLQCDTLPYLYMSLMIEDRAIWAYRICHSVLAEHQMGISLSGVLAEEDLHRHAMVAEIHDRDSAANERIPAFSAVEHAEFARFWRAIEAALQPLHLAAQ